jgi:hypothetical protein
VTREKIVWLGALVACLAGEPGCVHGGCDLVAIPPVIVTVTDAATGKALCGAQVIATAPVRDAGAAVAAVDDAAVPDASVPDAAVASAPPEPVVFRASTVDAGQGDGGDGCSGEYVGFLPDSPGTIVVTMPGYKVATVSVLGPAPVTCNSSSPYEPERIAVRLVAGP